MNHRIFFLLFSSVLLLASLPLLAGLRAEDRTALLLSPGAALTSATGTNAMGTNTSGLPLPAGEELKVDVDGTPLSFDHPEILFEKHLKEADFISAGWRDHSGQLLHQRDVLCVRAGYCVVVDYLYGTGEHAVVRSFAFPEGEVTLGDHSARAELKGGLSMEVQALDSLSKIEHSPGTATVLLKNTKQAPAPIPTVLIAWRGTTTPKVESIKPHNPMIVKLNITFPDGSMDELALAWESRPLHLGGKELKGWAACVRHHKDGVGDPDFFEVK